MTNKIPLVAVIGSPIAHSKSPLLHGTWLKTLGIRGHYIPMDVSAENFVDVVRMMPKMGFVGANVTIPHKEAALEIADHISDRASLIGAANTLTFSETGSIYADNTDGHGFITNLSESYPDWDATAGPALVVGAGGASRAILSALQDQGVPEIYLANRTKIRAEQLKNDFGARVTVVDWAKISQCLHAVKTLVNTTSLGMEGKAPLALPLELLPKDALVTDIVYTPLETPLLAQANTLGLRTVDGLGMLIHQAVPGFERWFGQKPKVTNEIREMLLQ